MNGYSVYLDDSGHPEDKDYLAVGGFIARDDRWIDFEKPWREILLLRGIDFPFHSADFFPKHRNDPRLKYIVSDLVRVITNHVEAAFSTVIDVKAYKEFNRQRRLEEVSGTPYAIVTRSLYENVDEWQEIVGPRSPMLFFVENGTLHRGDMMDCLKHRDGIVPPNPVEKDHVACQAADLYAYSIYQTAVQQGKPFLAFEMFMEKLNFPKERRDGKIFREELAAYLAKPTAVFEGIKGKFPVPPRSGTQGANFTFSGNKKKNRRGTVGLPKRKSNSESGKRT